MIICIYIYVPVRHFSMRRRPGLPFFRGVGNPPAPEPACEESSWTSMMWTRRSWVKGRMEGRSFVPFHSFGDFRVGVFIIVLAILLGQSKAGPILSRTSGWSVTHWFWQFYSLF